MTTESTKSTRAVTSTSGFHRRGMAAAVSLAAMTFAVLAGCAPTTGGTAAVAPNANPATSAETSTATSTETPRPTPTSTRESTTEETTPSPTTVEFTLRPTDEAGDAVPSTSGTLKVGDCYTVGSDGDVTTIDCEELHIGQVFAADVSLKGVDPEETASATWLKAASDSCRADFATFVGSSGDKYAVGYVIMSAPGASPVVACAVVDPTGAPWAGTAENISGSYQGIDVGDCFDYPTATDGALQLACTEPHEAEMYVVDAPLDLDTPTAPYPTEEQWQELSAAICIGPFADYTGRTYEEALDLSYTYVYPLEPDWPDVSQRVLSCAITSVDGSRLTQSHAG